MSLKCVIKGTKDRLDYDVQFKRWLSEDDRIVGAQATTDNEDIRILNVEWSVDTVKVWVEGGVPNHTAKVFVCIKTLYNREKTECFKLRIKDCLS